MSQRRGNNDIGFRKWKGIVTEQNIGQYEAEAAIDADNVEFLKDGTVQRRLGFEPESGAGILEIMTTAERSGAAFSHFLWEDINGIPGLNIRAIQVGDVIKLLADTYPVSQALLLGTIPLDVFASANEEAVGQEACQYAAGAGVLIIVNRAIEPIKVTVTGRTFPPIPVIQQQLVRIRWDRLEGEVPAAALGSTSLSAGQEFDLRNSGWPFRADCSADKDGGNATVIRTDPVAYYRSRIGFWPKVSILYSALRLSHAVEPAPIGSFSPWEVDKIHFGNTIPPKGHYITPAWSFDSRALMLADINGGGTGVTSRIRYFTVTSVSTDEPNKVFTAQAVYEQGAAIDGFWSIIKNIGSGGASEFSIPSGEVRVSWLFGANVGTPSAGAVSDGRGNFILSVNAPQTIKVGDRFNLL